MHSIELESLLTATLLGQFFECKVRVFWICSADLEQMFYVSSAYNEIWGRENINLDKCIQDFIGSIYLDDKNRVIAAFKGVLESGAVDEEYRIVLPDGSFKWIRNYVFPLLNKDKTQYIAGIAEEITKRKLAEVKLNQNEENFQLFANNAELVFWVCEPDVSKFYYISPGYEKIWGRSCESLYSNPKSYLELIHPDDLERVTASAFGDNPCNIDEEYRIITPDGTLRWMRDITFPIYDDRGNLYRMAGISTDISFRKQGEAEILKALQRERELSEAKTNFISIISHQIRTPLTIIQSSCDIIQHSIERLTESKKQLHFKKIETAIKEVSNIVQDVLMISEANANSLQFQASYIDIVELCHEIIRSISNHSRIKFVVPTSSIPVLVDSKLVRYIVTNLLDNSLKYSPISSDVMFNLNFNCEKLIFNIEDKGIGIPSASIPHIFTSFYRAGNVEMSYGSGLGLAIVKQCVDLHKGEILVSSVINEGTSFTVILPIS